MVNDQVCEFGLYFVTEVGTDDCRLPLHWAIDNLVPPTTIQTYVIVVT